MNERREKERELHERAAAFQESHADHAREVGRFDLAELMDERAARARRRADDAAHGRHSTPEPAGAAGAQPSGEPASP